MDNAAFSISVMVQKDLIELKDILLTQFDDFWNYNIFKSELENPNSTYFVIKKDAEIVGFIGILIVLDTAEITNIVIKKIYRNNGISKLLINYITKYCQKLNCKKINLEVNANNKIAINLYKSAGFKQVGIRKKYYSDGDALLFTKVLNSN